MSRQSKVDALKRLIAPDSGATRAERKVAKEKLARIVGQRATQAKIDPDWNQNDYERLLSLKQLVRDAMMESMRDASP